MSVTEDSAAKDKKGPLFLIDGNNVAYRAFYALPEEISTSGGFPTNALYGFCLMIIKILSEYQPSAVIVAWDSPEKTFRHEEFEEYKAQRKPMPEPLSEQWPYFAELCDAFGFVNLAVPGYEADDILATLARQAEAEGRETIIVTGDRDALQLVGRFVKVMANTKGMTEVKVYDAQAVEERFGVPPRLIPDLIGLKGDVSDNIPGIPGIGEKTAAELISRYGSLEAVLEHADEVSGAKRRELLKEYRESALLSKRLASLDRDVPVDIKTAELLPHQVKREKLQDLFSRLEFRTLFERIDALLAGSPAETTPSGEAIWYEEVEVQGVQDLSDLVDWRGTVALAVEESEGGGVSAYWLAQMQTAAPLEDYNAYRVFRIKESQAASQALGNLVAGARVVCHNFKALRALHGWVRQAGHDTYLAGYLLSPGRKEYRLEELAGEVGVKVPGGVRGRGGRVTPPAAPPVATSAALVLAVAHHQERLLREQGMWDLFCQVELPLTRVLIAMEAAGIRLDCYRLGELAGKIQDQLDELEERIYELAGQRFNLGSPQQLGRILFDVLKLPRQRKTKTGYSTDARTLEALRGCHPIIEQILSHRELSKLMSTYLVALPRAVDPETGRLHTTFHQAATATGRLSSSDPNLQNIPVRTELGAQIRQCFVADPGYLLLVADYSQIELRVMAYLAKEETLLEAFARGEDIHARTAAEVFGLDESEVDSLHRRHAKAVNFGIMYGISAYGLSQTLGIEREQAAAYIERYFERLPRVKGFIEKTIKEAEQQGYVSTIFGRRRYIPELKSGNYQERSLGERLAVNSVIQGSAADIIKVAMVRCYERLEAEAPDARLVLQVHDELVFEVPESQVPFVKEMVKREMVGAFPMDPPLGVDVGVGPDWLTAK
ncbi:MAG: DNA polymerase I [Thermoleophilia bacterium]|nr:DNA polymerase I [Thermoleophilia bacterium]